MYASCDETNPMRNTTDGWDWKRYMTSKRKKGSREHVKWPNVMDQIYAKVIYDLINHNINTQIKVNVRETMMTAKPVFIGVFSEKKLGDEKFVRNQHKILMC